jgi:hypothetical protein
MGEEFSARCDTIEKCYEFMLAYAGQGLLGHEGSASTMQAREYLKHAANALSGLAETYSQAVKERNLAHPECYSAFLAMLDRDSRDSLAAIQLVLAQSIISSQLIDNLNASIHLRALLTDLFLIDEILKPQPASQKLATSDILDPTQE